MGRKNGCVVIRAEGKSAHASTPWEGNSALTGLLALLMQFPFADCEGQRRLRGLTELFLHGAFYGEAAGVAQADELSGLGAELQRASLCGRRYVRPYRLPRADVCQRRDCA